MTSSVHAGRMAEGRWRFPRGLNLRLGIRLFAVASSVYGFWVVFNMDQYLPWQVRLIRGIEMTVIAHLGLGLATFKWRGKLRFVVAAALLPSMLGMLLLWWHFCVPVQVWLGWRLVQLIRGDSRADQSL